jgi:hypothetical protein
MDGTQMTAPETTVRFEEEGAKLTAIEIVRSSRHPVIVPLYRALLALGIVVSTYHVRPSGTVLAERMVLQRSDGQALDARLSEQTKAAILPVLAEISDDV